MTMTPNAMIGQKAKVDETVTHLVHISLPNARASLASGGTLSRLQKNEMERAARDLVIRNLREHRLVPLLLMLRSDPTNIIQVAACNAASAMVNRPAGCVVIRRW